MHGINHVQSGAIVKCVHESSGSFAFSFVCWGVNRVYVYLQLLITNGTVHSRKRQRQTSNLLLQMEFYVKLDVGNAGHHILHREPKIPQSSEQLIQFTIVECFVRLIITIFR